MTIPFPLVQRVTELLGLTLDELASWIDLPPDALATKTDGHKVDAVLGPIVNVLTMARDMTGSDERAAIWFKHQPIPGWAGKTAY
jgi:hypothetical protein